MPGWLRAFSGSPSWRSSASARFRQPLSAPLLAYIVLSGISTALSPDPYLSWPRMKSRVPGIGRNRGRPELVSAVAGAHPGVAVTAFRACRSSFHGMAIHLRRGRAGEAHRAGVRLASRGRPHRRHHYPRQRPLCASPKQLTKAVEQSPPGSMLRINYLQGEPFHKRETFLTREQFLASGLGTPDLLLVRGKPGRAQGTLGHYIVFAEMLMQLGCLAWAMFLSTQPRKWGIRAFFAIVFLALTAALMATQTRADIAGLAAGCVVALWLLGRKRTRSGHSPAWFCLCWLRRCGSSTPGGWIGSVRATAGTHFRVLMWEDGVRLIRQHPWFGVGMDTIFNHWQEWNIRGFSQYHVIYHFHSDYIQIAVERGLLTLAAWLWFVVAYLVFLFRLLRRTREHSRFATGVVAGVLAAFVGYLVPSTVQYCLGDDTLVMIMFFYFGLAVAIDRMLTTPGAVDVP